MSGRTWAALIVFSRSRRHPLMICVPLVGLVLGGAIPAGLSVEAFARAAALKPKLGVSVVVVPMAGEVRVEPRGAGRLVLLRRARQVPVGSTLDAAHGRVKLITASDARGSTQSGVFDGGAFVVNQQQAAPGLTDLSLVGGRANACGRGASVALHARAHQSLSSRVIRLLNGHAHGNFQTRGKYSAATVRGTVWRTEDTCQATTTSSTEGNVVVVANGDLPVSITVKAHARVSMFCTALGPAVAPRYCLLTLGSSAPPSNRSFAFAIVGEFAPAIPDYELCLTGPGTSGCTTHPLGDPVPSHPNIRGQFILCDPTTKGVFSVLWRLAGNPLGTLNSAPVAGGADGSCIAASVAQLVAGKA